MDFLLSVKRDVAAAKRFFSKAMKNNRTLRAITLDAYAASHWVVAKMKSARSIPCRVGVRSNKHLNNIIEQDHRRIKHRIGPMLGFKRFDTPAITISVSSSQRRSESNSSKSEGYPEDRRRRLKSGRPFWRPEA